MAENNGNNEVLVATYKLREQGDGGYVITVTPIWVKEMGLKFGDDIDVLRRANDPTLILRPAAKQPETVH